jgi:hypothetical protein
MGGYFVSSARCSSIWTPEQGIGGRIVAQTGGTNGYLAYRRSGYGGVETFLILGDPNAPKFRQRVMTKVVWPY